MNQTLYSFNCPDCQKRVTITRITDENTGKNFDRVLHPTPQCETFTKSGGEQKYIAIVKAKEVEVTKGA